jgi:hypothetical protein
MTEPLNRSPRELQAAPRGRRQTSKDIAVLLDLGFKRPQLSQDDDEKRLANVAGLTQLAPPQVLRTEQTDANTMGHLVADAHVHFSLPFSSALAPVRKDPRPGRRVCRLGPAREDPVELGAHGSPNWTTTASRAQS